MLVHDLIRADFVLLDYLDILYAMSNELIVDLCKTIIGYVNDPFPIAPGGVPDHDPRFDMFRRRLTDRLEIDGYYFFEVYYNMNTLVFINQYEKEDVLHRLYGPKLAEEAKDNGWRVQYNFEMRNRKSSFLVVYSGTYFNRHKHQINYDEEFRFIPTQKDRETHYHNK
jgi:hypothetical protein